MLRQPVRSEARQVGGATRRNDLDLLRALVVGLVFFHSAVIFGPGEFSVKAGAEYPLAAVFLAFGATWGMPLLFVIWGIGRPVRDGPPVVPGLPAGILAGPPARPGAAGPAAGAPADGAAGRVAGPARWPPAAGAAAGRRGGPAGQRDRPRRLERRQLRAVPRLRVPGRRRPTDRPGVPAPVPGRHDPRRAAPGGRRRGVRGGDPLIAMDLPAMGSGCSRAPPDGPGWWPSWGWPAAGAPDPGLRAPRPRCAAWASRSTTPCRPSTCSTRWPDTSSA